MEPLTGKGLWVQLYSVVAIRLANQPITAPAISHIMNLISSISFSFHSVSQPWVFSGCMTKPVLCSYPTIKGNPVFGYLFVLFRSFDWRFVALESLCVQSSSFGRSEER